MRDPCRFPALLGVVALTACGSSGANAESGGPDAQADASIPDADGGADGSTDARVSDAASDTSSRGDGGLVSCTGQTDGTMIAGGQICCGGLPIPVTADARCPALFHGSATGVSAAPVVGAAATPSGHGYWLVARDGGVFTYGDAAFSGSLGGKGVNDVVGIAADPAGTGYWLVGADGGVFAFGTATFGGSLPGMGISVSDIVGIAANPAGPGYWLAGKDGTVYALGGAPAATSAGPGVSNVIGIAANPSGTGYWLAGSDGGVFALDGAPFDGSLPSQGVSVSDIVGIAANPQGHGYWLIGSDGGVFTIGSGNYYASNALHFSSAPMVGMATSAGVYGYWMIASDGEVFVAPNAPPESTAIPAIGTSESYLGQKGSFEITVWDANGQRNCNEGPFAQIPGDPTHVIGRYSNTCTNTSNWSLARWSVDWTSHHLTFVNMIFDTRAGSVAIAGGNSLSTYYDATIISYGGELWVAGECGGTIAGAGTASACIGPLGTSSWVIDPARTNVAILGNQSLNDGFLYSASVPKLLAFQGGAYLYWSAVKISAATSTWAAITERATQLAEFPPTGGLLWTVRTGGAVGSADPPYPDVVWGLGSSTNDDVVADIGGIFTDGTSVFANGSIAGSACSMPFWPPTCYAIAFAKSANPLGNDVFNAGTVLPAQYLPTSTGGELRLFQDGNGASYLWGDYFTNVTGARP
ncbi:MAG TPA: hypothetical protein VMI75_10185, partial [Polyangiaceae bacterium]|nr:hypothetical protein [Polyangiaceae bacterium]